MWIDPDQYQRITVYPIDSVDFNVDAVVQEILDEAPQERIITMEYSL